MEMVDGIVQYMDAGKLPLSVFLDLSKAFHTIDHTILSKQAPYKALFWAPIIYHLYEWYPRCMWLIYCYTLRGQYKSH